MIVAGSLFILSLIDLIRPVLHLNRRPGKAINVNMKTTRRHNGQTKKYTNCFDLGYFWLIFRVVLRRDVRRQHGFAETSDRVASKPRRGDRRTVLKTRRRSLSPDPRPPHYTSRRRV